MLGSILQTLSLIYTHSRFNSADNILMLTQIAQILQTGLGVEGELQKPKSRSLVETIGKKIKKEIFGSDWMQFQVKKITDEVQKATGGTTEAYGKKKQELYDKMRKENPEFDAFMKEKEKKGFSMKGTKGGFSSPIDKIRFKMQAESLVEIRTIRDLLKTAPIMKMKAARVKPPPGQLGKNQLGGEVVEGGLAGVDTGERISTVAEAAETANENISSQPKGILGSIMGMFSGIFGFAK